jgi:protein-S-isoprenylcysteine O-methyltransferase Ste14
MSERAFNLLAGLSAFSWAVLGIGFGSDTLDLSSTRLCISSQHLCVGFFFVVRHPLSAEGTVADFAACLPSLLLCYAVFMSSLPLVEWPLYAELLFVLGTLIVLAAFSSLGRSFAILPALRSLVREGPYRYLRHPAYAGEFLMALACCLAVPSLVTLLLVLLLAPAIMWRICTEEKLLLREGDYADYADSVRWRLFPGLW